MSGQGSTDSTFDGPETVLTTFIGRLVNDEGVKHIIIVLPVPSVTFDGFSKAKYRFGLIIITCMAKRGIWGETRKSH